MKTTLLRWRNCRWANLQRKTFARNYYLFNFLKLWNWISPEFSTQNMCSCSLGYSVHNNWREFNNNKTFCANKLMNQFHKHERHLINSELYQTSFVTILSYWIVHSQSWLPMARQKLFIHHLMHFPAGVIKSLSFRFDCWCHQLGGIYAM